MSFKSSSRWVTAIFSALLLFSPNVAGANFKPFQIKAVYIFRIANFVRWDNEDTKQTLTFCVEGAPKIKKVLGSIIEGKTIRSMPLQLGQLKISKSCDIVFIAQKDAKDMMTGDTLHRLTISDKKEFSKYGGVIELQTVSNKIKPKINLENAHLGNYTIGSNLLRIAVVEGY
ncbi:YfiR family protein [Vibrio sp. T187]|uniref:YfiR family protein n=1 Tax=Vibrio TaxID=662 RepID=UPI0010C9E0F1|nr:MULTISPECIES: YfiR family protein [Vibrio]MBW3696272.1 YfiR family protein [Vibrio sp. T187]